MVLKGLHQTGTEGAIVSGGGGGRLGGPLAASTCYHRGSCSRSPLPIQRMRISFPHLAPDSPRWRSRPCGCRSSPLRRFAVGLNWRGFVLPLLSLGFLTGCAEGSARDTVEPDRGFLGNEFLMSPFTIADAVVTQLRAEAERASEPQTGSLPANASEVMIYRFRPSASASVAIEPEGWIVIQGRVGGERVDHNQFRSDEDPAKGACVFLLQDLVSDLLGWPRDNVYGDFMPVVTYIRAMGTAVLRDPDAARAAAEVLWANTRAEFRVYEDATGRSTECSATTTPDGWAGDLADW